MAEELRYRNRSCTLVVSRKKVDARLIKKYPHFEFVDAPGAPFNWKPVALIRFACRQVVAFIYAFKLLLGKRPDLVMGFGGFLTAGFAIPAWFLGIPFVLHEANRVMGHANRLLGRFATCIFLPPGLKLKGGRADRIRYAALPLRKEFQPLNKGTARQRLGIEWTGKLLVVIGGSQGAQSLNRWAEENCAAFAQKGIALYCLTGMGQNLPGTLIHETGQYGTVASNFVNFSDDMPAVLSAADVVVSRAGAGSIGEIIRCRAPSILIPYPFARDNHQWANARFIETSGATLVLDQADLPKLCDLVDSLIFNEIELENLQNALHRLDRLQEVKSIVNSLEKLIEGDQVTGPSKVSSSKQV